MVEGTQSQRALSQRAGSTSPLSTRSKLLEDAWVQAPHPAADKGNGGSEQPDDDRRFQHQMVEQI